MSIERSRPGILLPLAFSLAALLILLGLGSWQVERKAWKENLIATLDQRLNEAPIALPEPRAWPDMTPDNSEFARVRFHAQFTGAKDALVYTGGSGVRDDVKGPGYFVFSPARLDSGEQVVINRGFAPDKSYPRASGAVDIVGAVRFPEAPSWFVAAHDTTGEVWTARDTPAMARQLGWGAVAPFYIEQEAPVPPGGLPHPSPLSVHLRNAHLQYAITWYGLAAALVAVFAVWARRRRCKSEDGAGH